VQPVPHPGGLPGPRPPPGGVPRGRPPRPLGTGRGASRSSISSQSRSSTSLCCFVLGTVRHGGRSTPEDQTPTGLS
jgi:hypothetical protein